MAEVRVATFNVENLFARFRFNAGIDPEKAVRDGWDAQQTAFDIYDADAKRITAGAIKATSADVIALQEVENLDTLKRFRSRYLGGSRAYPYALAIDGNDPRLIDVAVLSKHPLVHARSYAHLRRGNAALFSRDCLEVDVLVGRKRLTLFVQHYKSMMSGRANTRDRRLVQDRADAPADRQRRPARDRRTRLVGPGREHRRTTTRAGTVDPLLRQAPQVHPARLPAALQGARRAKRQPARDHPLRPAPPRRALHRPPPPRSQRQPPQGLRPLPGGRHPEALSQPARRRATAQSRPILPAFVRERGGRWTPAAIAPRAGSRSLVSVS